MKVEQIALRDFAFESLRICLVQLASPFDDILLSTWNTGGNVFSLTKGAEDKYRDRIKALFRILDAVATHQGELKVLVLPEYSFLKHDHALVSSTGGTLDRICEYSQRTGMVVVGNCYDTERRRSESFITIPGRHNPTAQDDSPFLLLCQPKITRSKFDDDVLSAIQTDDAVIYRLTWSSPANADAYFQILTCKDYLYFTSAKPLRDFPDVIHTDRPGIIICPMCSPEIQTFESRALGLVRDVDISSFELSIISCFCNATTMQRISDVPLCGHTQIVSPLDMKIQVKPILGKGIEGCIVAELNPFRANRVPTITNTVDSGKALISSEVLKIIKAPDGTLILEDISSNRFSRGFVLNPRYLTNIGLRRVYAFLRIENYQEFKQLAYKRYAARRDASIALFGVYGIHDVLAISWEEFSRPEHARKFMEMRLWPMANIARTTLDKDHFGCCVVSRVWKFRGIQLDENTPATDFDDSAMSQDFRRQVRALINGEPPPTSFLTQCIQQRIVLETQSGSSDLSPAEQNAGLMEYLILITLIRKDQGPTGANVRGAFEQSLLPTLRQDPRIRTIEEIDTDGIGYLKADYILHVVGTLEDLNEIVLTTLHWDIESFKDGQLFSCGTQVVIPAESISRDCCPSLAEGNKQMGPDDNTFTIVKAWKELEPPEEEKARLNVLLNSIYLMDEEPFNKIIQSYFIAGRHDTPDRRESGWMRAFFAYAYGVSLVLSKGVSPRGMKRVFERYCATFVNSLGREVEGELAQLLMRVRLRLDWKQEFLDGFINMIILAVSDGKGRFSSESIQLGSFGHVLEALHGMTKETYKERLKKMFHESRTGGPTGNATSDIYLAELQQQLQGMMDNDVIKYLKPFADARNMTSHFREQPKLEEAARLLEGTLYGLRLLERLTKSARPL